MKKMIFWIAFLLTMQVSGQAFYTQDDVDICNSKFEIAVEKNLMALPINELMIEIGKTFLDVPYEAHTIEIGEKEELVVYLTALDCYTFFETTLVLSRCIKKGKTTFEDYQNELLNIRYRNGVLLDYASRLHYTSDWIYDNERRGIVKNVTCKIGGVKYDNEVSFMSEHPQSYKRLKDNPDLIKKIELMEREVNSREHYYIPQKKIADVEVGIQNGDIIGITTDINGLDVSHTGMAIRMENGRIHLLHAPMAGKKIQITESPLADYIENNKRQTGIIVARVLEPEQK